jgi:hypothetical protein
MADTASNEDDRQFWLRIAEGWSKRVLDAGRVEAPKNLATH